MKAKIEKFVLAMAWMVQIFAVIVLMWAILTLLMGCQ